MDRRRGEHSRRVAASTRLLFVLIWAMMVPASVFAQASIVGVVRDSSGAVLPGVTVEISSPVLIALAMAEHPDAVRQCRRDMESDRSANVLTLVNLLAEVVRCSKGTEIPLTFELPPMR